MLHFNVFSDISQLITTTMFYVESEKSTNLGHCSVDLYAGDINYYLSYLTVESLDPDMMIFSSY